MFEKIDGVEDGNNQKITVPCSEDLKNRYANCSERLKKLGPKKVQFLTNNARKALEAAIKHVEETLNKTDKAS